MIVSNGWNTAFGQIKFNLDLDMGDLADTLAEHGIALDAPLTRNEKFYLLNNGGLEIAKYRLAAVITEADERNRLLAESKKHRENVEMLCDKLKAKYPGE